MTIRVRLKLGLVAVVVDNDPAPVTRAVDAVDPHVADDVRLSPRV